MSSRPCWAYRCTRAGGNVGCEVNVKRARRVNSVVRLRSTMQHNIPVETALGYLDGRDCIYLDRFVFEDGTATFVLDGSINGNLCTVRQSGRFVPFTLRFRGVLAIKMVELDSCDWDFESSFDEIRDSSWIKSLGGKITAAQRHFFVQTYDYVFDVVGEGYEFEVHTIAAEPSDARETSAQSTSESTVDRESTTTSLRTGRDTGFQLRYVWLLGTALSPADSGSSTRESLNSCTVRQSAER